MAKNCRFRKKDGRKCGADAQHGKEVCVFHDQARAADGHRARRAGGLNRNRPIAVLPPQTPDHPLNNTQEVSLLLGESINQVRRGQLDPRVANAVGYLASILLGALQQGPLEDRLSRLEATLGIGGSNTPRSDRHMSTRRFQARIEQLEQAAKAKSAFPLECICFPESQSICFHWPIEEEIAAKIKCPLHGDRFKPQFLVYAAQW